MLSEHYDTSKQTQVGQGTYGEVFKSTALATGQRVAVKRLKTPLSQRQKLNGVAAIYGREGLGMQMLREITILKRLSHENIVRLVEVASEVGDGAAEDKGNLSTKPITPGKTGARASQDPLQSQSSSSQGQTQTQGGSSSSSSQAQSLEESQNQLRKLQCQQQEQIPRIFLVFEFVQHDLVGIIDVIKAGEVRFDDRSCLSAMPIPV